LLKIAHRRSEASPPAHDGRVNGAADRVAASGAPRRIGAVAASRRRSSVAMPARLIGRNCHRPILALICAAAAAMALGQAIGDAPSTDEPLYVTAGLFSLIRYSLWVNPQHPPVAKALAAAPVLLAEPVLPSSVGRRYSRTFLDSLGRDEMREITLLSRLVPVLEVVITALAVYALARRLSGPPGGLLAAALWLFDPFVIGIGHIDGIDLPGTLTALALALAIVRWIEHRTWRRVAAVGRASGAARTSTMPSPRSASTG
jgi:hypothetical protein